MALPPRLRLLVVVSALALAAGTVTYVEVSSAAADRSHAALGLVPLTLAAPCVERDPGASGADAAPTTAPASWAPAPRGVDACYERAIAAALSSRVPVFGFAPKTSPPVARS